ncbi:MAG: exodeoxyribonuclease I [Candidatus Saccharimonas sp.]|nr:MAG: exodeoxyribonuclease I [Candidatus Saccharimonas sp.]
MKTFFFYDLETSGFSPQNDRIMQFAGQRTDENLNRIGEPINILVRLNDDVLPSPSALMVTKISPQKTVEEGYTEAEFSKMLVEEYFTPDTVIVGYNNVRFDDVHIQHLLWRNFYPPYDWQWKDGRSRWDLLDVVRMIRALRPEGINWPFIINEETGEKFAANKLELLTKENGILHENAHDAMSDVDGLIDVARLLKEKQPQIFDYLFKIRSKNEVQKLVNLENPKPFVYTSGRFKVEFEKTTVAFPIAPAKNQNVIVWDLRFSPEKFIDWSEDQILENITADFETRSSDDFEPVAAKILQYNKCPAVAPMGVLTDEDQQRLKINLAEIQKNLDILRNNPHFAENLRSAFERRSEVFQNKSSAEKTAPEARLFEGFVSRSDDIKIEAVRNSTDRELADFHPDFADERLTDLLLHYKARNFPKSLSSQEKELWEEYRVENLQKMMPNFMKEFQEIANNQNLNSQEEYILEEIKLWLENILPETD